MLTFFFQRSVPPRDLHSFPTRRSSDLFSTSTSGWVVETEPAAIGGDEGTPAATEPCPPMPRWVGEMVRPDRKSTRLNSSHVAISYAVFCLKKKKDDTWTNKKENAGARS